MEGFTLVDGGVAVIIVLSAILAYSRGFVREAMAIAGWVGAAFLAFLFAPQAHLLSAPSRSFPRLQFRIEQPQPVGHVVVVDHACVVLKQE